MKLTSYYENEIKKKIITYLWDKAEIMTSWSWDKLKLWYKKNKK